MLFRSIQGTLGSYHDIAAHKYFEGEEIELICCANFEDVFGAIKKDSQTIGMLAIENTIAHYFVQVMKVDCQILKKQFKHLNQVLQW